MTPMQIQARIDEIRTKLADTRLIQFVYLELLRELSDLEDQLEDERSLADNFEGYPEDTFDGAMDYRNETDYSNITDDICEHG